MIKPTNKKIRCINEDGRVNFLPYHLAIDPEYMIMVGYQIQDPEFNTLEEKKEVAQTMESIEVANPNEIGNIFDTINVEEKPKKKKPKLK